MAKEVKIRITAVDRTKSVLAGVKRELISIGRITRGLGRGISSFTRGVVRGFRNIAFAATAVTGVLAGLVKVYTVQEDAEARLAAALGHTGQKLNETMASYKEYAASIQDVTTFGDEEILSQIAYARNLGVTEDKLKETTTAAIGLAAKLGIDLKTSMMLMGRAALGQTQMLTRYGIVLDENLDPQEKFNLLLKIGAKSFKLAEAAAKTTAGRFKQFKNRVGDVFEQFGGGIVDALNLNSALDKLSNNLDVMLDKWKADGTIDEWAEKAKPILEDVAQLVKDVFEGGEARTKVFDKMKAAGVGLADKAVGVLLDRAPLIGEKIGAAIVTGVAKAVKEAPGKATRVGRRAGANAASESIERINAGGQVSMLSNIISGGATGRLAEQAEQLKKMDELIAVTKDITMQ